ncbi:MAG: hypothetical protein IKK26_01740 [Clostridia bacterium]|nr:hypothetical protein [Clostridia bacterium]
MIKLIYISIIMIVGAIVILAGIGKLRFAVNFAEDRPEYSEKQHKIIGVAVIIAGALLVLIGVSMIFSKPDSTETEKPKKTYCNACGGDLLCDICGEDGEFCEYSVFKAGDGAHYCSIHWSDCAAKYKND